MGRAVKMAVSYGLFIILLSNILGCATARQGNKWPEIQQLQARINELEKQLQEKKEEIYNLEDELIRVKEAKAEKKITAERPKALSRTPKNIQIALKNAGFYKGTIDGKIGEGTKKAIKDFQRAKGLTEDGVVGKKTWSALKKHLSR